MTPPQWSRALRVAAPVLVLAYAVVSIALHRNLIADGSVTFVNALTHAGYWPVDPYRTIGGYLAQTPFALATAVGVSSVPALEVAHGVGYVLIPALVWAAAMWISRRTPWFDLLVLGYCATALTSGFVAVSDTNQLFAVTALCFAAAVRFFTEGGRRWAWLMAVCALALTLTHGLALLLAPLLIATVILLRRSSSFDAPLPRILALVFLAVATVVSVVAIVHPYSPANLLFASDMTTPLGNPQLRFLIVWLVVLPLAVLPSSVRVRRVAGVVLAVALGVFVLVPALWGSPMQQHSSRTFSAIILALLLGIVLVTVKEAQRGRALTIPGGAWLSALSFALLVAFLVPVTVHSVRFASYLDAFQQDIVGRSGDVLYADFVAAHPDAAIYGWSYSFPSMSVLLGLGHDHAMVLSPADMGWIPPFDPHHPPTIPDRFLPGR